MEFKEYLEKYAGKSTTDAEIAQITALTIDQVKSFREFYQQFVFAAVMAGKAVTVDDILAARYAAFKDERPLADDEEWWSPPYGAKIRRKKAAVPETAGETKILAAIAELKGIVQALKP
jgi:hypothetical protein